VPATNPPPISPDEGVLRSQFCSQQGGPYPRPETELLVDIVLEWARTQKGELRGVDLGCGSGNLAITLAYHLPEASFYAVDLSTGALQLAKANALRHGVRERVHFFQGDYLDAFPEHSRHRFQPGCLQMIEEYFKDADGLNIMRATKHPRATESIDDIIHLISILFEKGFAYTTDDGVYFSIDQYPSYGKLSGHKLDDLIAGASERVSELEGKRNPLDFALWKFKKEGEPFWESPWGDGRPVGTSSVPP